ncbi:hypothetical protein [Candidatus Poriferisodalis sp.]|uniref:hypothetical protein n=1 Tax=Candidatus Poriferisodalis sp. TaxID=3101277 RepID=UPI003AF5E75F
MNLFHSARRIHIPFTKYWIGISKPLDHVHLIVVGPHIWRLSTWYNPNAKAWIAELKTETETETKRLTVPTTRIPNWKNAWELIASRIETDIIFLKDDNRKRAGR